MRILSDRFLNDVEAIAERFAKATPFKHVLTPEFFARFGQSINDLILSHCKDLERIHNDCRKNCEHVRANVMRALDIGHGSRVQTAPFLAEDGVPSPADELMHTAFGASLV
jgi:hypothetical protein